MEMVEETTWSNKTTLLLNPSFAGLVVLAESLNPIPFRTRPLNFSAPMILRLKTWESRSLPGLPSAETVSSSLLFVMINARKSRPQGLILGAGWSSPVARQAHNLKVVGSNPTPATKFAR